MALKRAALAAIIGAGLMTVSNLVYTLQNSGVIGSGLYMKLYKMTSFLTFAGLAAILLFFIVLYSNQNR